MLLSAVAVAVVIQKPRLHPGPVEVERPYCLPEILRQEPEPLPPQGVDSRVEMLLIDQREGVVDPEVRA
jgi:hypothetical protein